MAAKEKQVRETIITFLMSELNISQKESQSQLVELEEFGLIEVKPNGQLYLKVV